MHESVELERNGFTLGSPFLLIIGAVPEDKVISGGAKPDEDSSYKGLFKDEEKNGA